MKRTLLVAALTMVSVTAFAQKARVSALQGADHIVTTRSIFTNPAKATAMADWATFEMGDDSVTASPRAEGGFMRAMWGGKFGFHLGNATATASNRLGAATGIGAVIGAGNQFILPENTFEATYVATEGMKWGASFIHSSSDNKSADAKQSTMGARFGVYEDMWDAYINLGLGSTATGTIVTATGVSADPEAKFTGKTGVTLGGGYNVDTVRYYAKYEMDGFEMKNDTTKETSETTSMTLGFVNSNKADGVDFYYGAAYTSATKDKLKEAATKTEVSRLPFYIGVEADATSWMTIRGSVSQNVLVGSTKVTGGKADSVAHNTTVAAGTAFKFGKVSVDNTLGAATDGDLFRGAANNTFANASLTYMF